MPIILTVIIGSIIGLGLLTRPAQTFLIAFFMLLLCAWVCTGIAALVTAIMALTGEPNAYWLFAVLAWYVLGKWVIWFWNMNLRPVMRT